MLPMNESGLSLKEKQHNIGFPAYKLPEITYTILGLTR